MSDNTAIKMVTLKTSDGKEFKVSETVAKHSKTISRAIEDISTTKDPFPLSNVTGLVLKKVIQYCEKHVVAADESKTVTVTKDGSSTSQASLRISDEEELRNWDKQFLNVDTNMLFDLIMAANYLEIKGLLDTACQKVADLMAGKSPEEIRQTFSIKNDFTPEEEKTIQLEHAWAFV